VNFTYSITDQVLPGSSATAVVTIVIPSPGGPNAVDDSYACPFNAACPQTGILGNDASLAGGTLTVTGVAAQPAHGQVSWRPDGSFTYTPST
jgi:hypothetical protein